jgi:hypothetical protein
MENGRAQGDAQQQAPTGHAPNTCAVTLRRSFRPLRPDLDKFLFATVGDEIDGIPLSVISVLARLGLDPWAEADRLSSLSTREAVEQLARLTAELSGMSRPSAEAREIADHLIGLLPQHDRNRTSAPQVQIRPRYRKSSHPRLFQFWIVFLSSRPQPWSARWFTADFRSVLAAPKRAKDPASRGRTDLQEVGMSVRLKIEDCREGLVATISQRDDTGRVIGRPSIFLVGSKEAAKQQAKTLARSLGLQVYGIVNKSTPVEPRPS